MDYNRIHNNFINYFKVTTPRERLEIRCSNDERLKESELYVELHHILPKSQGGNDDYENFVEVLPEEHVFIHYVRWKAYKNMGDIMAVNFMINGFLNKDHLSDITINKILRKTYSLQRRNFGKIIFKINRNNPKLKKRLMGKMFAKDKDTGAKVGLVSLDHPNVVNGTWVHQNHGRAKTITERAEISNRTKGLDNPNAYKISNEDYLYQTMEYVKRNHGCFSWGEYKRYCNERGLVFIKTFAKARFGSRSGFYNALSKLCEEHNINFTRIRTYDNKN